ncbi:MAG TPA: NUDIX hydrolase [Chthoniobacterales bacterium]
MPSRIQRQSTTPTTAAARIKGPKEVSVMAWIENQFGEVLLLKQSNGRRLWTLPGGKVRTREALATALRREVLEETGLQLKSLEFAHLFDRPRKSTITFVYRVTLRGKDTVVPKANEIETAQYWATLPRSATPSLAFFWKQRRG